jgi:hypothetical protein
MARTTMGRTVPRADWRRRPYATYVSGDWTWYVLKAYQHDPRTDYARWFCLVVTPYTGEAGDLGDVYAADVFGVGTLVQVRPELGDDEVPQASDLRMGWKD